MWYDIHCIAIVINLYQRPNDEEISNYELLIDIAFNNEPKTITT